MTTRDTKALENCFRELGILVQAVELSQNVLLDAFEASDPSAYVILGNPDSAVIGVTSQTIIPANGAKLVVIANLGEKNAWLAIGKTAVVNKGIFLEGEDAPSSATQIFVPQGAELNAIADSGIVNFAWQFFERP